MDAKTPQIHPQKIRKVAAGKAFTDAQAAPLVTIGTFRPNPPDPAAQRSRAYRLGLLYAASDALRGAGIKSSMSYCYRTPIPAERERIVKEDITVKKTYYRKDVETYEIPMQRIRREVVPTGAPGEVSVAITEDGRATYHGLQHCGGGLTCPICGPVIAHKRGQEVQQAAEFLLQNGFKYLFLTLTASHDRQTKLSDFIASFSGARNGMYEHRRFKEFAKRNNLKYRITATEVTDDNPEIKDGTKSGWHFHNHIVLWFKRDTCFSDAEVSALQSEFTVMWRKQLQKRGLTCDDTHGAHLMQPKNSASDTQKVMQYIAKSLNYELTQGRFKVQRGEKTERRVSSWRLLELMAQGNARAKARWLEYAQAIKGISLVRCSPGLKAFCGIEDKTDGDLMQEGDGRKVYTFEPQSWRAIAWQMGQAKILDIAEDTGGDTWAIQDAVVLALYGIDIETGEQYDRSKPPPIRAA